MFKSDYVIYNKTFDEFDYKKEFLTLYDFGKKSPATFLIYRYKSDKDIDNEDIYFAKECDIDKIDYWIITKQLDLKRNILLKPKKLNKAYKKLRLFNDDDELTEDSKIKFVKVSHETALYYRDLFAHRLGDVKAEIYYLMLIDNKVCSTVGFHTRDLFSLKTDRIFEVYGFSVHLKKYPRINRLMMMCITSQEFGNFLKRTLTGKNRIFDLKGMRTTCLTKYRKNRLNIGVLDLVSSDKLPNGMYRIMYDTDYKQRSFKDIIKLHLQEQEEMNQKYGKANS